MDPRNRFVRRALLFLVAALLVGGAASCSSDDDDDDVSTGSPDAAQETEFERASGSVRGFDGTTVKIAGMGIKSQLPGAEWGVQGRIKRFNDANEIDGVKIEYVEYVDDKNDPAAALTEARRLVTAEKVFAIVGDTSANNPGDYFAQQHVPYIGWAFDFTYCTEEPDPEIWGFGVDGCLVPDDPPVVADRGAQLLSYMKDVKGVDNPTIAMFSNDNTSGRNSVRLQGVAFEGAGWDVVFAKGNIPVGPVADYTPYVQELLTSDGGEAPDAILCLLAIDCIPVWQGLKANNFGGVYQHSLYSDLLLGPMEGTVASIAFVAFNEDTPALNQMKADVAAVKADQAIDTGVSSGYRSADMFIQALKTIAAEGKDFITPENLQKALANQTWEIEGLAGPTTYPDSSVSSTPLCASLVENSDGTAWKTVIPYNCSDKTHPVN